MTTRLMMACALVLLLVAPPGCSRAHEGLPGTDDAGTDAQLPLGDAGGFLDVAFATADSTVIRPDDTGPLMCTPGSRALGVRVEPITLDTARCLPTHVADMAVTGVEAEPSVDGIRIHTDYCPTADADCRCDIILSNVGSDVAASLSLAGLAASGIVVDLAEGDGTGFGGAMLSLGRAITCDCVGCPCAVQLVLFAQTGEPDPSRGPPEIRFSRGRAVCPEVACVSGSWQLHADGFGGAADVPEGADASLGLVRVRSLRDVDIMAPCAACAGCDTPRGSWVAWILPG